MHLKKTIEDWASRTFSLASSSFQVTIEQLPCAPPFLFTVSTGLGYCITIKPSFSSRATSYSPRATAAAPPPCPVESCLFIPPGPATAAEPLSAFSSPATRNPLLATAASPQLGLWIPESGGQGSQCTMGEGDEEILTYAVDWSKATRTDAATGKETLLANEDALSENLTTLFAEFLRDDILLPALEKYLNVNDIAHEPFTIDMVGGIESWDEKNWVFLFLPEPVSYFCPDSSPSSPVTSYPPPLAPWNAKLIPPGSAISGSAASVLRYQSSAIGVNASVLGITGDGRAALFSYSRHAVDPRGYVDHINLESQATGIDSPAALQSWLEEMLATIPA